MSLTPTSSRGASGGGYGVTITKTADQSVTSSNVKVADSVLQFTTTAGSAYVGEIWVVYGSPAGSSTPGILYAFGEDGTDRGSVYSLNKPVAGGDSVTVAVTASTAGNISARTATANLVLRMWFTLIGGGGTAAFWWAQATANAGATIVRTGSVLEYSKLT